MKCLIFDLDGTLGNTLPLSSPHSSKPSSRWRDARSAMRRSSRLSGPRKRERCGR